jgi:hypothetical protein
MTQKFANAARAYLASTVSDSATTVTIDGGGSLFPAISSPEFSRAVLQDANGIEVVRITAHTANSDSFTVTRGQEGTTARSFATGSVFGIRMTAADGDTFVAKVSGPGSATDSALAAFDGTTGKLVKQAATVTVAQGGTGATSLTANNVILGNGTSAVQAVAPGTTGNVLTSNGTTWVSGAPAGGGATISNDTSTATNVYPLFADATSGTPTTIYTSNAKLLYKPSTGEFQAPALVATNGILLHSTTISANYTIASGSNGFSVGPITIASGISVTVASGQRWVVI